jgi:TRAP-type uncharacterized transport system substrate-binding protein
MSAARLHWKIFLATAGLAMFCLAAYNYVSCYCRAPIRLTLSGGNVCPLRSEMAKRICGEVRNEGIELAAVVDTNSETICRDVNSHRLDLGLVLGGFAGDQYRNVRQVATLGVEPLHLLVRRDKVLSERPSLDVLRGMRISLGEQGTNGAKLATDLLRLAGFTAATAESAGDYQAVYMRESDTIAQLRTWKRAAGPVRQVLAERLPEAFFIVDSLPSPLVDELVKTAGYRLVPLPYATALRLNNRRDAAHVEGDLESSRIEVATIPAYTYGLAPAAPTEDCATIGLRLLLIAHKDVSAKSVVRLLRALDKGLAQRYHVDLDAVSVTSEFAIHPGAAAFAKDRRPLSLGQLLEPLTNFLSVIGAGAAGGLALWGFIRGLMAVHPDVHLRQIDRIERLLAGSEHDDSAPTVPREFIDYLEGRLAQIKQTAIEDYASGRLQGEDALMSILTLTADTRHLLVQRRKQVCQDMSSTTRASHYLEAA